MRLVLLVVASVSVTSAGSLRLKRVTRLDYGPSAVGTIVCYDSDHDSVGELIFSNGNTIGGYQCWSILEYRPYNRYEVEQSDTAPLQWPPGVISTGRFWPSDAGDIDQDGRTELTGQLHYLDSLSTLQKIVCILESRDSLSHPDSMIWSYLLPSPATGLQPSVFADLDRDGRREVFTAYTSTMVFENVGDNRESLVYSGLPICTDVNVTHDFDLNGRTDYVCNWAGSVRIMECAGDNRYVRVCSLGVHLTNGNDQFTGDDVDQNGRPEFFVVDEAMRGSGWKLYLYMFEATAEHVYTYWLLDSEQLGMGVDPAPKVSLCADLDGDSVEEIIWSCCTHGYVLRATGPQQFRRECLFMHDHGPAALCSAADFNGNGYKELFVGSCDKISVFEVEPVRVMYPAYRRETLVSGDTCQIRWRIYTPPRCDSVSLFLKTDTVVPSGERFWRLDTIAIGLAPSESSFAWVVPDTQLAWAKVLAIAFGPGWQYDESDSAFAIVPAGIAAAKAVLPRDWALSVSPNPAGTRAVVSYDVPVASEVRLGLYDAAGRLVAALADGRRMPGRYTADVVKALPAGVYLARLESAGYSATRKLVVQR